MSQIKWEEKDKYKAKGGNVRSSFVNRKENPAIKESAPVGLTNQQRDQINAENFKNKFPFSTLIFLLWLHDIKITNQIAKLFVLHSDNLQVGCE